MPAPAQGEDKGPPLPSFWDLLPQLKKGKRPGMLGSLIQPPGAGLPCLEFFNRLDTSPENDAKKQDH